MKLFRFNIILIIGGILGLSSCGKTAIPRPYGYFRVDLPAHSYRMIDTLNLPYRFEIPKNAVLISRDSKDGKFWVDIDYPKLNATIYCSYKPVNGNLIDLLEDTRKIVYKHSVRADGIGEKAYDHKENNVHGILYDLKGNAASSFQFFVTDSINHFLRASLYFNNRPNYDSLTPIIAFIRQDMVHLVQTLEWSKFQNHK